MEDTGGIVVAIAPRERFAPSVLCRAVPAAELFVVQGAATQSLGRLDDRPAM